MCNAKSLSTSRHDTTNEKLQQPSPSHSCAALAAWGCMLHAITSMLSTTSTFKTPSSINSEKAPSQTDSSSPGESSKHIVEEESQKGFPDMWTFKHLRSAGLQAPSLTANSIKYLHSEQPQNRPVIRRQLPSLTVLPQNIFRPGSTAGSNPHMSGLAQGPFGGWGR